MQRCAITLLSGGLSAVLYECPGRSGNVCGASVLTFHHLACIPARSWKRLYFYDYFCIYIVKTNIILCEIMLYLVLVFFFGNFIFVSFVQVFRYPTFHLSSLSFLFLFLYPVLGLLSCLSLAYLFFFKQHPFLKYHFFILIFQYLALPLYLFPFTAHLYNFSSMHFFLLFIFFILFFSCKPPFLYPILYRTFSFAHFFFLLHVLAHIFFPSCQVFLPLSCEALRHSFQEVRFVFT